MKDIRDYSLLGNNTFGIESICDRFIEYSTLDELIRIMNELRTSEYVHIGAGSNLLFAPSYHGTVLHSAMKGISVREDAQDVYLTAMSGEIWDDVVLYAVCHGYYGMENLSFIPGEAGSSAIQNIGAYGVEAKDIIHEVKVLDVESMAVVSLGVSECGYKYRESRFKREWKRKYIVISVTYHLSKVFEPKIEYGGIRKAVEERYPSAELTADMIRQTVIDIRKSKLPDYHVMGNAGSFFMNPVVGKFLYDYIRQAHPDIPCYEVDEDRVKIPAGWLIEKAGWKGRRMGKAAISEKQALVIVNLGGASSDEILSLADAVRADVLRLFGLNIRPEVNYIG